MAKSRQMANFLRYTARGVLLLLVTFWFIFALLSGSEAYGGGLSGVIQNSPNALPWLLLYGLVFISWKSELVGGILITAIGIFTIYFFQSYQHLATFLGVSVSLIVLGMMLVGSWWLHRDS